MEVEEPKTNCDNCNKDIPESKFTLHQAYCIRNITKCPKCKEPIEKSELEDHDKENHSKVQCQFCFSNFENNKIDFHKGNCKMKPRPCQYCTLDVSAHDYEEHINRCSSRTKKCEVCQKSTILRDYENHVSTCIGIVEEKPKQRSEYIPPPRNFDPIFNQPGFTSGRPYNDNTQLNQRSNPIQRVPIESKSKWEKNIQNPEPKSLFKSDAEEIISKTKYPNYNRAPEKIPETEKEKESKKRLIKNKDYKSELDYPKSSKIEYGVGKWNKPIEERKETLNQRVEKSSKVEKSKFDFYQPLSEKIQNPIKKTKPINNSKDTIYKKEDIYSPPSNIDFPREPSIKYNTRGLNKNLDLNENLSQNERRTEKENKNSFDPTKYMSNYMDEEDLEDNNLQYNQIEHHSNLDNPLANSTLFEMDQETQRAIEESMKLNQYTKNQSGNLGIIDEEEQMRIAIMNSLNQK